jgi:hypothetical protein
MYLRNASVQDAQYKQSALQGDARLGGIKIEAQNNAITGSAIRNENRATAANTQVDQALKNYQAGRGAILNSASQIEQSANNAPKEYQQTANAQFMAQQDANQRQALALGATGGAGGLRTALAASSQANAQASNQAGIQQAQELNAIRAQQQSGWANAAAIRGSLGGQDQSAANINAARVQSSEQLGLGSRNLTSQNTTNAAQLVTDAAAKNLDASQQNRLADTQAVVDINTAQLNADREREAARQARKKSLWSRGSLGLIPG